MTPLVLVAEDDPGMLRLVRRVLTLSGYRVLVAEDGPTALELASSEDLTLVLLDIGLPGLDGLTICSRIREFSNVPIVIITAREDEEDVVRGLNLGADDYLSKPFGMKELLARVQAVLRRARPSAEKPGAAYACGELLIDFAARRVHLAGRDVHLTPTEYRLLVTLASHAGRICTQQQLVEQVWGPDYAPDRTLVHVTVRRVRRKIEPDVGHPRYLLTSHGIGYYLAKPD
jgi:DNA-binding response OmpR family regulator